MQYQHATGELARFGLVRLACVKIARGSMIDSRLYLRSNRLGNVWQTGISPCHDRMARSGQLKRKFVVTRIACNLNGKFHGELCSNLNKSAGGHLARGTFRLETHDYAFWVEETKVADVAIDNREAVPRFRQGIGENDSNIDTML